MAIYIEFVRVVGMNDVLMSTRVLSKLEGDNAISRSYC